MQKTILCVHDSLSVRQWVASELHNAGYNVITATNGNEAAARVENTPVDMVLAGLIQSGAEDGIAITSKFRAMQRYKFTPVLIMTTESQAYRKDEGRKAGASAWIEKPFTAERLRKIVRRFVW